MTFNGLMCETVFPNRKIQIPCPGVARKKKGFRTGLCAGIAKATLAVFEIYARITALASLQDVGFTRLDAGVTTKAMGQKVRVFLAPGRTDP
jgi:hypothetical protein